MLNNYIKTAWRNITRHKTYAIINVFGLALGISSCIVIFLITNYEFSFDKFHFDGDRIYRVMGDVTESTGNKLLFARVPSALSLLGHSELSGIDEIGGVIPFNAKITIPDNDRPVKNFQSIKAGTHYITTVIANPEYFNIFKYDWLAGNSKTALNKPFTVVLTESKAILYFGDLPFDKMIGKQIEYQDSLKVIVSGIVKDWDKNTDLSFTDFISFSTIQNSFLNQIFNNDSWTEGTMSEWTFVKISKGMKPSNIDAQLISLVKKHAEPIVNLTLWLEPLSDIHFRSGIIENPITPAYKPTLYILMGIALFILILAVMNFINLSTAQSFRRIGEVSVRKVLGSNKMNLVFQFLIETLLLTLFSVLAAVALVEPILLAFSSYIPKGISFRFWNPSTIIFLLVITIITSLSAGLYPAFVLSSHLPVWGLSASKTNKGGGKWILQKGLIVFQFSVSLIFIISSIVIIDQLKYAQEKDLGFNPYNIISIEKPRGSSQSLFEVFSQKIKQIPGVDKAALQWLPPMSDNPRGMKLKLKSTDVKDFWVKQVAGNEDFIPLYNIKLLAGRNLVKSDSVNEFVINETLSHLIGDKTPSESLGRILYWNDKPYPVVGVVADFHTQSLHDPITPLCIINRPNREGSIAVKFASNGKLSGMIGQTLFRIKNVWKNIYPSTTFNFTFYDQSLALLYEKDRQTGWLVNTAALISIIISCMGLFGLSLFTTEKRTKEIGIRKILGASIPEIISILAKEFIKWVIIANIIAWPVAYYLMHNWLKEFAYRININLSIFILSGSIALIIALLTVSTHAIKAATANPIKSLRYE